MKATQTPAGKGQVSITIHNGTEDIIVRKAVVEGKYGVVAVFTDIDGNIIDEKPTRDMGTGSKVKPSITLHQYFNDLAEAKAYADKQRTGVVTNRNFRDYNAKYKVAVYFAKQLIQIEKV